MELVQVDSKNIWKLIKLTVRENQKLFVASNTVSLLEAYVTEKEGGTVLPFGLFENKEPVGFVMFGYGTSGDEDEPKVAAGNYCIWRLMIDERFQHLGYGRKAMEACLAFVRTFPCGPATKCWLSYEKENEVAKKLYASFGFFENGEMCGDETVAVKDL